MNGRKAKARRRAYDPRQYQVFVQVAIEWNAVGAGKCAQCNKIVAERRSRVSAYDSGYSITHNPRPGESDDAHANRVMREMSARKREGDFSLICPPRSLCLPCAKEAARNLALAAELAQSFGNLLREHHSEALDSWLAQAESSGLRELRRFALGLRQDYAAVRAAVEEIWSQGPTEGHIQRLKLLKRQGYGRASFRLLRQRVLLRPGAGMLMCGQVTA